MVNINNEVFSVTWDEQENEFRISPQFGDRKGQVITMTGRQASILSKLIVSAIELPSGHNWALYGREFRGNSSLIRVEFSGPLHRVTGSTCIYALTP